MGWLNLSACMLFAGIITTNIVADRRREPTDGFRMFGLFRKVVAISSSSNDTSFKCLRATLTSYNLEEKKATYVWHLKARGEKPARNITFDIEGGDIPDQATYFVNNDRTRPHTAYYNYTDYENCMVMIVPYNDHDHCLLWVKRSVVHNVPQNCLDNYEETCDVRIPQYEHDLCGDDE
uniref:Putative lipocalin-5 1 n=1 Tax=Amblyomma triste TaxID=251400 RepID=A0A023GA46_AMBTT